MPIWVASSFLSWGHTPACKKEVLPHPDSPIKMPNRKVLLVMDSKQSLRLCVRCSFAKIAASSALKGRSPLMALRSAISASLGSSGFGIDRTAIARAIPINPNSSRINPGKYHLGKVSSCSNNPVSQPLCPSPMILRALSSGGVNRQ